MSRFLNPPKISLLVLIQFYRDGTIPLESSIPILSFISSHIIRRSLDQGSTQDGPAPASIHDFEALLSTRESGRPGRSLYDIFLGQLWELQNLVTFTDFLRNLPATTQPAQQQEDIGDNRLVCSPTSPIGQFTRRCHLESVRLQFSDAYQLWENFVLYREPTKKAYLARNPDSEHANVFPNAASANLLQPEEPAASSILIDRIDKQQNMPDAPSSLDDVEKAIHFQLSKLQKYGTRVSEGMKAHLERMTGQGASVPSEMHFIK